MRKSRSKKGSNAAGTRVADNEAETVCRMRGTICVSGEESRVRIDGTGDKGWEGERPDEE